RRNGPELNRKGSCGPDPTAHTLGMQRYLRADRSMYRRDQKGHSQFVAVMKSEHSSVYHTGMPTVHPFIRSKLPFQLLGPFSWLRDFSSPEFFEKPACSQILDKRVVKDLGGFSPDIDAFLARRLDRFCNQLRWHDHTPIDESHCVRVIGRLKDLRVLYAQGLAHGGHRRLRIFFYKVNRFGEGGDKPLHQQGFFLQGFGICENRAVDEGKSQVVEVINHVEAILPALDIQRRLDERGLDEVLQ